VVVPITNRCNLNCNYCFFPDRVVEDASLETIKLRIRESMKFHPKSISLSGGEPTLRDDLLDIIDFIHSEYPGTIVSLLTNGIKLKDEEYVSDLKKHKLDCIIFSFNGTCDDIYMETNNANLIEVKLQALRNIKKERIETVISPTFLKSINEEDAKKVMAFVFDNLDFVRGVRTRGMANVGYHSAIDHPFVQTEMIEIISNSFDDYNKKVFNNIVSKYSVNASYHSTNYFSVVLLIDEYTGKIITWDYFRSKRNFCSFIHFINMIMDILKERNMLNVIKSVWLLKMSSEENRKNKYNKCMDMMSIKTLKVDIFCWFDKNNLDIVETSCGGCMHVANNGSIDFMNVVILDF
jgi:uncharacterized radical SAM superfamily Fe-S cluster-containing enzyme